jgi:hypothetical protein
MSSASHGAAPNAVGYQHQTWWGLVELLRSAAQRPDAGITLELHDDVAWERSGSPTELLQVKHHQGDARPLTDTSTDVWRTLKVWMDEAAPGDASGPDLFLVTTQMSTGNSAMSMLRRGEEDPRTAQATLEAVARDSKAKATEVARQQFLELDESVRTTFISRIHVVDGSPHAEDVAEVVKQLLHWALPSGHKDLFLGLVWRWWDERALALLQGRERRVDATAAHAAINDIRDRFASENLPTLIELDEVEEEILSSEHAQHVFVQQMAWVRFPPVNLQKAIVDYYRAYTQTARWLSEDLIGIAELDRFERELIDEWQREFEWMLDDLDDEPDERAKQRAGKALLRDLLARTSVTVRARYNDPFFARGQRHILADRTEVGWHPDFRSRVEQLLHVDATV